MPRKKSGAKAMEFDDETLDRAHAAHQGEWDRWCWRRTFDKSRFELIRNSSPNNDIMDEQYHEIIPLTRRECRDKQEAEMWLNTYRGRAAMTKALEAL